MHHPIENSGVRRQQRTGRVLAAALWVVAATLCPTSAAAQEWEWTFTFYGWLAESTMDVEINDKSVFEAEVPVDEVLDKLESIVTAHLEGVRGSAGFFVDLFYMEIADGTTTSEDQGMLPSGTNVGAVIESGIYELGGIYRPGGESEGFDLLFGLRIYDYEQNLELRPPSATDPLVSTTSETYADGFVGGRYITGLNDRWSFNARADVGGGDTEGAFNALVQFGVGLGKKRKNTLVFGYRQDFGSATAGQLRVVGDLCLTDEGQTVATSKRRGRPLAERPFRFAHGEPPFSKTKLWKVLGV